MKLRTLKLISVLWLACCHVIIVPTESSYFWNDEIDVLEDLSGELKTLQSYGRKVSRKKENLESFYKEWLLVTAETIESLNRTRDDIIQATKTDNYITVAMSIGVGTAGAALAMLGGAPLLLATIPTYGASAFGVQFLSGTWRYSMSKDICNVASIHMNTTKRYTNQLIGKMDSYFKAMASFKEFLKDMRGAKILKDMLLYEIAKSEGFLKSLNIDKETEKELRSFLLQIIEYDTSRIEPHIWILDTAKNVYEGARSLVDSVRGMINEIKKMFESDMEAKSVIITYINDIYEDWKKNNRESNVPRLEGPDQLSRSFSIKAILGTLLEDTSALKELVEIENFVSLTLTSLVLTGQFIIGARAGKNLLDGSPSVESEEILKAMEKMVDLRSKVVEKMKVNFGW